MEEMTRTIFKDPSDVDRRLAELQLQRPNLINAGKHALAGAANASPLHPANAAGTFSYHEGVKGLRIENIGGNWEFFCSNGIEGIRNDELRIYVLFANVDQACGDVHPQARSPKGTATERITNGDMFEFVDIPLPESIVKFKGDFKAYYLMVDRSGAMELSLPVVRNKKFMYCVERIFIADGDDFSIDKFNIDVPGEGSDLDVVVTRKS